MRISQSDWNNIDKKPNYIEVYNVNSSKATWKDKINMDAVYKLDKTTINISSR